MTRDSDAPWRNEELLHQKYVVEDYSSRELARAWDCDKKTVLNWLEKFDIDKDNQHMQDKPWQDKERLRELYVNQKMSCREVAESLGCSETTAAKWLRRHGLYRVYRNPEWLQERFYGQDMSISEMANEIDVSRRTISEWLDRTGVRKGDDKPAQAHGEHTDKETLKRLYHDEGYSTLQIADKLECSPAAVRHWMIRHNIKRREWYERGVHNSSSAKRKYPTVSESVDGQKITVSIHRLLALATGEIDFDEFCDSNIVIHHRTNTPWDNRPVNLVAMDRSEHTKMHNSADYYPEVV